MSESKSSMKLPDSLIICSSPNGRGIHRYCQGLARVGGIPILSPERKIGYALWEQFGIVAHLQKVLKARYLFFVNTRVSPLLWPFLSWQRTVVVVHDLMETSWMEDKKIEEKGLLSVIKVRLNTWLIRESICRAQTIVVNSRTTLGILENAVGVEKKVIRCIRPLPSFSSLLLKTIDPVLEIEGFEYKILAVTGHSKNKALSDYFLVAERILSVVNESVEFNMVGVDVRRLNARERDIYNRYKRQIRLHYRVSDSELLQKYVDSDLFVSLSYMEGFGIPVADALGFGMNVIVRDIDVYRELAGSAVRDGGNCNIVQDWTGCARLIEQGVYTEKLAKGRISRRYRASRRQVKYAEHIAKAEFDVKSELSSVVHGAG